MSESEKQKLQSQQQQKCGDEIVHEYESQTSFLRFFITLLTLTTIILVFFTSSAAPTIPISFNLKTNFKPPNTNTTTNSTTNTTLTLAPSAPAPAPTCPIHGISPFYIYTLPPEFNTAILSRCNHLSPSTNMCPYITNNGLGPPLNTTPSNTSSSSSWYATNQFTSELIFHARALTHPCRVTNPSHAKLFYIPFYGGLHASSVFRIRNLNTRDSLFHSLAKHMNTQPLFTRHNGLDHFLVVGRIGMDFMRELNSNKPGYGQNTLFNIPSFHNTSLLSLETDLSGQTNHQFAIPYPSYFHPTTPTELTAWQTHLLTTAKHPRRYLFSFIGATRNHGGRKAALRDSIIKQCKSSSHATVLDCSSQHSKCMDPTHVMKVSMESEFCLQPPGDSFTRRSTFDSMLSGCVPVFFSPYSAYTQYGWYLPEEEVGMEQQLMRVRKYSVYIDMGSSDRMRIDEVLGRIKKEVIWKIRENIVKVLPRFTYMNPEYYNSTSDYVYDAVDVTLQGLSRRVNTVIL